MMVEHHRYSPRTTTTLLWGGLLCLWAAAGAHAFCPPSAIPTASARKNLPAGSSSSSAFVPSIQSIVPRGTTTTSTRLRSSWNDDDDDDDDEDGDDIDLSDKDWRAFRAKLVMGEPTSTGTGGSGTATKSTTASPSATEQEKTAAAQDDDDDDTNAGDLDGIGALFASEQEGHQNSSGSTTNTSPPSSSSSQSSSSSSSSTADFDSWAYDSGSVVETGAVILGGVEQEFGFGLRQQYFHKAVILVLDHDDRSFTKGIILNRPSDLTLAAATSDDDDDDDYDDDDGGGGDARAGWRLNFGGDVQGLTSSNPDVVCLHSLQHPRAQTASVPVIRDLQYTTLAAARQLVQEGCAAPDDFWVFCGYAGWGPGQLRGELERQSWCTVSTDAQTLWRELLQQRERNGDPRDAGLDTWRLLMRRIGRGAAAAQHDGGFDDSMLKEWARQNLLSEAAGGGGGMLPTAAALAPWMKVGGGGGGGGGKKKQPQGGALMDPVERLLQRVTSPGGSNRGDGGGDNVKVEEGMLVRASAQDRSPFLLGDQSLHKSLVLIVAENEMLTVGVILNRPGAKGLQLTIKPQDGSRPEEQLSIPLRYGGKYAVKGSEPLLWLHCHPVLKAAQVGAPVGKGREAGFWKCTDKDVMSAVGRGLATPEDFLVVTGVSVWTKGPFEPIRGMEDEIQEGRFEVVPVSKSQDVLDELKRQPVITSSNLSEVLGIAEEAWKKAGNGKKAKPKNGKNGTFLNLPIGGLGEGFDEEDDSFVYNSDVKVSKLSDDALRNWVATFLLGDPHVVRSSS